MNGALSRPWRAGQNVDVNVDVGPNGYGDPNCCYPNFNQMCPPDPRLMAKNFRKRGCPPMNYGYCPPNGGGYAPQGQHMGPQGNWWNSPWCPGSEPCQDKLLSSIEVLVPASGTVAFSIATPEMFKGERLYVVSSLAQYFRINSLQIGSELIFINPVYADVINEASNDITMNLPTMSPGVTASGTVTNLDTVNAHPFIMTMIGKSLCY